MLRRILMAKEMRFADKLVGNCYVKANTLETAVQFAEPVLQADHRRLILFILFKTLVDSRLAGLLMFQEFIGHP